MTTEQAMAAAAYYTKDTLDVDRWFRVADADYQALLGALDLPGLFADRTGSLRLLDVGCGTGRFPVLLRPHLQPFPLTIDYDTLDPSEYCLQQIREVLQTPYRAGQGHACGAEDLADLPSAHYDIVWAIHSLYYVSPSAIGQVIRHLRRLLVPAHGTGLAYIATDDSFYLQVLRAYRACFATPIQPLRTAQEWADGFHAASGPWRQQTLRFIHEVPVDDEALLQSYLHKCVLDASQPLSQWWQHARLHQLIDGYRDGDLYRFPQQVTLFQFGA